MRCHCQYCGRLYDVATSDAELRYTYCGGWHESRDMVPISQLLRAERNPLLTPAELDELVARFREERMELT